jgi:hypothetical protein
MCCRAICFGFRVPGFWFRVSGSGCMFYILHEHKTRNKEQGTRNKEQGTRNKKQGTRNKEQETRYTPLWLEANTQTLQHCNLSEAKSRTESSRSGTATQQLERSEIPYRVFEVGNCNTAT